MRAAAVPRAGRVKTAGLQAVTPAPWRNPVPIVMGMTVDPAAAVAGIILGAAAAAAGLGFARRPVSPTGPPGEKQAPSPSGEQSPPSPGGFSPSAVYLASIAIAVLSSTAIAHVYGRSGTALSYGLLAAGLVAASITDLSARIIPNALLAGVFIVTTIPMAFGPPMRFGGAAGGAALCGAVMMILYVLARGRLGGGDVKLAVVNGWVLGPGPGLLALTVGFIFGALGAAVILALRPGGRRQEFAYGPFLAAGALAAIIWGPRLMPHLF